MPLSEPHPREKLHTRTIVIDGYRRADGLYDIEAHLTDTKTRGFANEYRGFIEAGEPLHGMWLRLTVDDRLRVVACEAASEQTPYAICSLAAPNFASLAGLQIKAGFLREANHAVGGPVGCTHLRELLGQMGTVAFQTMVSARQNKPAAPNALQNPTRPALLNSCLAYEDGGETARRTWPEYYGRTDGPG